jgi:hypothetical protein
MQTEVGLISGKQIAPSYFVSSFTNAIMYGGISFFQRRPFLLPSIAGVYGDADGQTGS